jgi:hypothetical protein
LDVVDLCREDLHPETWKIQSQPFVIVTVSSGTVHCNKAVCLNSFRDMFYFYFILFIYFFDCISYKWKSKI